MIGSASQITYQQFFALSVAVARVFRRWLSGLAASYELDYYFRSEGTLSMIENLPKQLDVRHDFYVLA